MVFVGTIAFLESESAVSFQGATVAPPTQIFRMVGWARNLVKTVALGHFGLRVVTEDDSDFCGHRLKLPGVV